MPPELEQRVLELWSSVLGADVELLSRDGLVVVPDRRAVALERRATIRTARGTLILVGPHERVPDPKGFAADVEARATDDALFHYLVAEPRGEPDRRVRVLGASDRALLDALQRAAGADATEEAEVDVEHPLAVGVVEDGRLLAIGSLLTESDRAVDVGVLVHPAARRRGLGAAVVTDLARRAATEGLLVQYRCRTGNEASGRLARACGFALWGVLTVAPPA